MKSLFNVDNQMKIDYLKSIKFNYEKATYQLYTKLIYKLDEFEHYKGTSAMNMTKADFIELLTSLNSTSLSVLYTYKSAISSYLIFAMDAQKFRIGILQIDNITKEDLIECINTKWEAKQFITEEEYYELLQDTDKNGNFNGNYQDKLVLVLLWNKIKGERNYSEILNLKKQNVDLENRTITLPDRKVKLSEREIEIVKKAMNEKYYIKTTLNKDHTITKNDTDYVTTDYLIRSTIGSRNTNMENNDRIPSSSFANRLSKYFNIALKRSELTGLKIYKSSIYYYMILEYKRVLTTGELQDYLEIHNLRLSLSSSYREQEIMYNKLLEQGLI